MHRLDGHINDLEPRIQAIYTNTPKQTEPSLQVSLSSYGWILLDSWVAWKTLRFLLKESYIDERVNEKWFQTPSSYTASQIKVAWNFSEKAELYIKDRTGKGLKELFDKTIQEKRNASAHFTKKAIINGSDCQEIKLYFTVLSRVFLFYETSEFVKRVIEQLSNNYNTLMVYLSGKSEAIDVKDLFDFIDVYEKSDSFYICGVKEDGSALTILFDEDGCFAGNIEKPDKNLMKSVINSNHSKYYFWGNKGFYQDVNLFVQTVYDSLE